MTKVFGNKPETAGLHLILFFLEKNQIRGNILLVIQYNKTFRH